MGMARIQVVIDPAEREVFRAAAERAGQSLSEWLREAGRQRLDRTPSQSLADDEELDRFFVEIDGHHARAGEAREPDWEVHKQRIVSSTTPPTPS